MVSVQYNSKTLGNRTAQLVAELNERRQPIFSIKEVIDITGLAPASARSLIAGAEARGVVTRLKPGLFNLVPFERGHDTEHVSDPSLIARRLVGDAPYFISHGSALELHRMVTQPQLSTIVSCTKRLRPQIIHGYEFRFIQIRADRLFGITDFWVTPEDKVRISDPERTIVDGLDLPQYVGGVSEIAKGLWMKRDTLDVPRLIDYALRLDVGAVIRRLGYLLELYGMADRQRLEALRIKLTPTYQRLDPLLPNEGPMLSRWRIRLNLEPDELEAVRSS
jgi:predicted transcriptional regulator of viral defense system